MTDFGVDSLPTKQDPKSFNYITIGDNWLQKVQRHPLWAC